MKTETQKTLMIDNISMIAYIRHGAKLHNNGLGIDRWTSRLREAINICFMLELLTDEEIDAAIRSGEEEREKES